MSEEDDMVQTIDADTHRSGGSPPSSPPGLPKNAARNAEIIRRRRAGEWPTEIAKAMGIGRNMVIGVCHRNGLQDPNVDRSAIMKLFCGSGGGTQGEAHWNAKLTDDAVRAIRRDYRRYDPTGNATLGALAERHNVTLETIRLIVHRRRWTHVA